MEVECDFRKDETISCKIKDGWEESGRTGQYFGNIMVNNRRWAIVLWDDDEAPDMHKAEGILISETQWKPIDA